jgi:anti-sigma-K factor RskA
VNVEEFISSGILESYILGNASPEEIRKVQEMEKLYPQVRQELDAIESSLMEHAESYGDLSSRPEKELKNKLFTTASNGSAQARVVPISQPAASSSLKYAVAACLALFVTSAVVNYILYTKLDDAEKELAAMNNERSFLADQMKAQQVKLASADKDLQMVMHPANKIISLKGSDLSPSSSAMIVWNKNDKAVFLHVSSLPEPPAGKQYQLWALVDGKPVDAGVFTVGEGAGAIQQMKVMQEAQAFAVTLEKTGGSLLPTLEAMYLIGNV